ncbi:MAG: PAS domain-containing protein [Chloroflexi bacterium]|nr:PAS domain-containing protein [Chloroflexota bacterium]
MSDHLDHSGRVSPEAYRQIARFVDSAEGGLVMVDPHGVTTYANRAAGEILGAPFEALRGRRLTESVPASWRKLFEHHLGLGSRPAPAGHEWMMPATGGGEAQPGGAAPERGASPAVRVWSAPVRGESGEVVGEAAWLTPIDRQFEDETRLRHTADERAAELTALNGQLIEEIEAQDAPYGLRFVRVQGGFTLTGRGLPQAFKVLPLPAKLKAGLPAVAKVFDSLSDQKSLVKDPGGDHFVYVIERCSMCWGREVERPGGFIAAGIIEESLRWLSGGRTFRVDQMTCIGMGHESCDFAVYKEPIG